MPKGTGTGLARALGAKPGAATTLTMAVSTWFGVRQERGIMSPFIKGFRAGWPSSVGTVPAREGVERKGVEVFLTCLSSPGIGVDLPGIGVDLPML
jgi:hypothetical protein